MKWSLFLCWGSTLAALLGLLVLGWGARRERRRLLWVLIAALLLIGAGFGAAEMVYQLVDERDAPAQGMEGLEGLGLEGGGSLRVVISRNPDSSRQ